MFLMFWVNLSVKKWHKTLPHRKKNIFRGGIKKSPITRFWAGKDIYCQMGELIYRASDCVSCQGGDFSESKISVKCGMINSPQVFGFLFIS